MNLLTPLALVAASLPPPTPATLASWSGSDHPPATAIIAQAQPAASQDATPAPPNRSPRFADMGAGDWASDSVGSLIENYGCLEGFPDGTFRGEESMTRYQFAAGMNACLKRLDEKLQEQMSNLVTREDLALLFRILSTIFEQVPEQPGTLPNLQTPSSPPPAPNRPGSSSSTPPDPEAPTPEP